MGIYLFIYALTANNFVLIEPQVIKMINLNKNSPSI